MESLTSQAAVKDRPLVFNFNFRHIPAMPCPIFTLDNLDWTIRAWQQSAAMFGMLSSG